MTAGMMTATASAASVRGGLTFVLRRTGTVVVTLFFLAVIVFLMTKAIPGDEAHVAAGESATPDQVAAVRERLGLDQPLPVQLGHYLRTLLHGDLGTSIATGRSVGADILAVLPQTLELVVLSTVLMVLAVVPAAIAAALHRNRPRDVGTRLAWLAAGSLPTFWIALELQYLLGTQWRILPISGRLSRGITVPTRTGSTILDSLLAGNVPAAWNAFQHLLLPALVLMLPFAGQLFRALRAELLDVLGRDHITVARATGMPTGMLLRRHALPNAAGPALTVLGIEFGTMVATAVLVEGVFGLNGLGSYLTTAVQQKDTFAVLSGVLVVGVVVVLVNFAVDLVQLARDPRLRSAELAR
ncbi:ABC transporter permease [Pseudonocardia ailaonensis]|uniref:ABC transporter permease n=1 Tax=Pseudonocardia ailaonensis TaxID=367279 RepID=A0ABN2N5U7_9PSEU